MFNIHITEDIIATFYFNDLTITLENSYKAKNKKEIIKFIDLVINSPYFDMIKDLGFTRTKKSLIREWAAHNFLYEHNYKRERTKDTDLDQNESLFRRIGYFFLSLFYK